MRKILTCLAVILLCSSMFTVFQQHAIADPGDEDVIFFDDFESYAVGTFPSAGSWTLVYNGMGNEHQKIVDEVSFSGSKSFQLWGKPGWSACADKAFTPTKRYVGYEAYVMTTGYGPENMAIHFMEYNTPALIASVNFGVDSKIYSRSYAPEWYTGIPPGPAYDLNMTYVANRWYKVKVVVDRNTNTYDVWIDDTLRGHALNTQNSANIRGLRLGSGHSGVKVYFDDVTVFHEEIEYWVPLVFAQSWPGNDFASNVEIYALQDSIISVDGGPSISLVKDQRYTYSSPHIGTHIIVETGSIIPFYSWFVNDYGIWDDNPLGYTLLPSSKLGTKYLIPIGGLVSVVATQAMTVVNYSGAGSPITLANPGDNVQFEAADGSWVESNKPIAVAVGKTDPSTRSDSWAYAPLPNNLIGISYHFGKRVPMDPYFPNQIDLSKVAIMATDEGATISIDGTEHVLGPKEVKVISTPHDDISINSDKPISVVYLQRIQHSDPWNGETRYTSYAYSLIPKNLWGLDYVSFGFLKTHLIAETDVSVKIGSNPSQHYGPGVYDLGYVPYGTIITADKPIAIEQIGASDWSGVHYHAQGQALEIFPVEFYQLLIPPQLSVSINPHSVSILVGQLITFTSTVSGGLSPYSYQWYVNGTAVEGATSQLWMFTPTTPGTYLIHLNVTDSIPQTAKSNTATVAVAPQVTVSISPTSASILVGQSVTFTSTASGGYLPYTYQWLLNGVPVSGATSASWTFTPTTAGIYYVHLKVTDDKGNTAQSDAARITVSTVPVGGYSIPTQTPSMAKQLTPYIILTAALTIALTTIKRAHKTTKKTKKPP